LLFVSQTIAELVEWGFEVDQEKATVIQFVKLLLDPSQELPEYASRKDLEARLRKVGKTAVQAAADYLVNLKQHVLDQIEYRFGESLFAAAKIEYIVTVPAVWSDAAKDATKKAAELAGMENLSMITEPEAAALCALKTIENVNAKEKDVWIVCDAGGGTNDSILLYVTNMLTKLLHTGTVDLISYEIISTSPFSIEEAVPGDGDVCGSGLINMRFQNYLKTRMGAKALEKYIEKHSEAWAQCLSHFEERTKRDFDPERSPDKIYQIPMWNALDEPDADIENNKINLSTMDLTEIHRPVIESTLRLIHDQYEALQKNGKSPRGLILVGGFGKSKLLMQEIKNTFSAVSPRFEVVRPSHSWSAVAIGAIIHRIEGASLVRSRIVRRHYGIITRLYHEEGVHSEASKTWDADEEVYYADNVIRWHATKGQSIQGEQCISIPFYITGSEPSTSELLEMVVSDEDYPPLEFEHTQKTRRLCSITADLSNVPRKSWLSRKTTSGNNYVYLKYNVGLTFGPGGLQFDVRVGENVVGTAKADYEQ